MVSLLPRRWMCCRRRRPPHCWSPGGPTPPSVLAPQPPEHCPGNNGREMSWDFELMLNQSDLFLPYHSIGISESVTYHFWSSKLRLQKLPAKPSAVSLHGWENLRKSLGIPGLVSATTACPFHRLIKEQRGEFLCKALWWTLLSFNVILPELQTDLL